LDKALFIPVSYDEDKQKALSSGSSMIKAFFEVVLMLHEKLRRVDE
jgi:hypothetical protein